MDLGYADWVKLSEELMTVAVSEETYQDDLRYERAVWPEKFRVLTSVPGIDLNPVFDEAEREGKEWRERILLALQGIDVSLEELAKKDPVHPEVNDED